MKNIILIGASRAGKSTFTKLLNKELDNVTIIRTDLLRLAFRETFCKDKTINTNNLKNNPDYINFIISYYNYENKYNIEFLKIVDTVDFEPKDYQLFDNSITICLGYPNITAQEVVKNWRKYDTELDWTKTKSYDELLKIAEDEINKSQKLQKDCEKYNVKFIDTSFNRNNTFKELLKDIIKLIKD